MTEIVGLHSNLTIQKRVCGHVISKYNIVTTTAISVRSLHNFLILFRKCLVTDLLQLIMTKRRQFILALCLETEEQTTLSKT